MKNNIFFIKILITWSVFFILLIFFYNIFFSIVRSLINDVTLGLNEDGENMLQLISACASVFSSVYLSEKNREYLQKSSEKTVYIIGSIIFSAILIYCAIRFNY